MALKRNLTDYVTVNYLNTHKRTDYHNKGTARLNFEFDSNFTLFRQIVSLNLFKVNKNFKCRTRTVNHDVGNK